MLSELEDRLHKTYQSFHSQVCKNIAFAGDRLFDGPCKQSNVRLTEKMLGDIKGLVGENLVLPLEEAIIEHRLLNYRGLILKLTGQTWFITSLAFGTQTPEETALQLTLMGIGAAVEFHDRDRTFPVVREKALPVMSDIVYQYENDLYRWPDRDRLTPDWANAIAQGESLAHPQLTSFVHTILSTIGIAYGGKELWGAGLLATEILLQVYVQKTLRDGASLQGQIDQLDELTSIAMEAKTVLERDFSIPLVSSVEQFEMRQSWTERAKEHALIQFLLNTGIPLAAVLQNTPGLNLFLALSGTKASYFAPVFTYRENFAQARAGILSLQKAIETIKENRVSLIASVRIKEHCQKQAFDETVQTPLIPNAIASLSPFTLYLPGKKEPMLKMDSPLILTPGFVDLSGSARGGKSNFLQAVTHRMKTQESKESLLKIDDEWVPLHSLYSRLKDFFAYVPPEPKFHHVRSIAPRILFAENLLLHLVPENEYLHSLIMCYREQGHLNATDKQVLQLLQETCLGLTSATQIYSNRAVPKSIKDLYFTALRGISLPTPEETVDQFIQQFETLSVKIGDKLHRLFSTDEIQMFVSASSMVDLPSRLRAKLRFIQVLKRQPKVIAIDSTLDALPLKDVAPWIHFMGLWCEENEAAILLATRIFPIRKKIRQSPHYNVTIEFSEPIDGIPTISVI